MGLVKHSRRLSLPTTLVEVLHVLGGLAHRLGGLRGDAGHEVQVEAEQPFLSAATTVSSTWSIV